MTGLHPNRGRINYWADAVAFLAGLVVFATGLVLLTRFHMGDGALRNSALGASRLVWVNVHRLTSIALLVAVAVHGYFHWRVMLLRVTRFARRQAGHATRTDLILYFGFALELVAGFVAWTCIPGSPSIIGPVTLAHLPPARHVCIDVHNFSGLVVLPAVVVHVRHNFQWLIDKSRLGKPEVGVIEKEATQTWK